MLIALVQKTARSPMYNKKIEFSSRIAPWAFVSTTIQGRVSRIFPSNVSSSPAIRRGWSGGGMYTAVLPEYETSRGREARVGKINLYLHFNSRVSSVNPKKIIKQIENNAELKIVNWSRGELK